MLDVIEMAGENKPGRFHRSIDNIGKFLTTKCPNLDQFSSFCNDSYSLSTSYTMMMKNSEFFKRVKNTRNQINAASYFRPEKSQAQFIGLSVIRRPRACTGPKIYTGDER